jgi:hypothetical protein
VGAARLPVQPLTVGRTVRAPIWLVPPPGLVAAAAALPRPAAAGDPAGRWAAVLAGGAAGAYAWVLDGPEAGRRVWGEQAELGLAVLEQRLEDPGADSDRFALGSQVSAVARWAWLAGDPAGGRRADLVACELAAGGWPGRRPLDRPDLVLLCDPTGRHALDHAGSRVRLGSIRDFPVAGPENGGSWRRPGTVDRLLDQVSRQRTSAGRCWERPPGCCGPWSTRPWGRHGRRPPRWTPSAGWPPWPHRTSTPGRSPCRGCSTRPPGSRAGWPSRCPPSLAAQRSPNRAQTRVGWGPTWACA